MTEWWRRFRPTDLVEWVVMVVVAVSVVAVVLMLTGVISDNSMLRVSVSVHSQTTGGSDNGGK